MEIIMRGVNDITPYEHNPRRNDDAVDAVAASIKEFGFKVPIVVDKDGIIVAGHTRLKAAKKLGMEQVPCIVADDLTDEQIKAFRLADNKVAELADWDFSELETELADIDMDMSQFGFDDFDIDANTEIVEDEAPEPPEEPKAKRGEIYRLGNHRLMCGDSTSKEDVAALMDGERADMVFTDPPYGMNLDTEYDGMFANDETHKKTGSRFEKVIGDNEDFDENFIKTIFENFGYCKEVFIWGADYFSELIPNRKEGSWVCWDKRTNSEMDKVAGNTFELCFSKQKHKRLVARILWSGWHGMGDESEHSRCHPTQKPLKLVSFFFDNWGEGTKTVVDLFGGSGSTLIACEQTGRKCHMMELDPHYVDVIIERWENLTGQKAVLLNG